MKCPACKADNPTGAVPCPTCGSANTMIIRDPDAPPDPDADTFERARDRDSFTYDRPTSRQDSLLATALGRPADRASDGGTMTGTGTGTGPTSTSAPAIPSRLGSFINKRYELLQLLGKGGMGLVYRAKDHELDEEVAIKLLQPEYTSELSEIERLKREIVTARRITHPNVIRIHEFGMDEGGEAFISMEVLPGGSLEEELRQGLIAMNRAINIAIGLCEGLGSAHEQGIIHRDLKPENVLFAADGRAKLVDFGLARSAGSTQHTVWGVTGTPRYMSPEQSMGGAATPRTDVYSMGVLLFQLFTGEYPFDGRNIEELAQKHAEQPPPKPRGIRKEIPAKLEAIILKALEKDPQKRWRNANEMATELRAIKESSNPGARPPEPEPDRKTTDPTLLIRAEVVDARGDGSTVIGPRALDPRESDDLNAPTYREPPKALAATARAAKETSNPGARMPSNPGREPSQTGARPHDPRREPSQSGRSPISSRDTDFSARPTAPPIRTGSQPKTEPNPRATTGTSINRLLLYAIGALAVGLGVAASYFIPSR